MNLEKLSIDELTQIREEVTKLLKERREMRNETERKEKEKRKKEFSGNISIGDIVEFLFYKEKNKGLVVNVSDKSVTVLYGNENFLETEGEEGTKKYIKYENILNIVEKAEEERKDKISA